MNFTEEKRENKNISCFYPILVSSKTDHDSKEEIIRRWDRFDLLSDNAQEKVSSEKTASKVYEIKNHFNLDPSEKIIPVSRAIRSYYFGELTIEDMPFALAKEMNIDLTKAKEIAQAVITKIINDDSQEKAYQANLEKLVIPEALKQYPDLGEQLITENRIKIQNFPEPARPSLKNWLADYVMLIGRENRNAVKRGSYLFQSENGKNLSSSDRQRLAFVLKSLDENTPVTINKNTKQLMFPQLQETSTPAFERSMQTPIEPKNNIQSVQFSYPQKPVTQRTIPLVAPPVIIPKPEVRNNLAPNVVNLKD